MNYLHIYYKKLRFNNFSIKTLYNFKNTLTEDCYFAKICQ